MCNQPDGQPISRSRGVVQRQHADFDQKEVIIVTRTIRQLVSSFALIATLPLSMGAAWAQQPQPQTPPTNRPYHLGGSIASVSDGTFVLTARDGRSVTVRTTASTRIVGRQPATLADIRAGDSVRVFATKAADGTLTARAVQDVPSGLQTSTAPRGAVQQSRGDAVMVAGTVAGSPTAGSLTITSPNNQNSSVAVPATARVSRLVAVPISGLTAGARVMVQGTSNADGSVTASVVFVAGTAGK
jgi:hypothetical protein